MVLPRRERESEHLRTACVRLTYVCSRTCDSLVPVSENGRRDSFPRLVLCAQDLIFVLHHRVFYSSVFASETQNQIVKRLIECVPCVSVPLSAPCAQIGSACRTETIVRRTRPDEVHLLHAECGYQTAFTVSRMLPQFNLLRT